MYLTAHWVHARDGSRHLNAVLYRHGDTLPEEFWSQPPEDILRSVATTQPGERVAARLDTIPGGNDVECFLDVVGADGTSIEAVRATLALLRATMERSEWPRHVVRDGVIAEFSVVRGEQGSLIRLDELSEAALSLYADPRQPSWPEGGPLVIEVTTDEEGLQFRLGEQAVIALELTDGTYRETMRIRFDVKDDFEQIHGPIYPHVAEWLTGQSREELLERGGVRFEEPGRDPIVWPVR